MERLDQPFLERPRLTCPGRESTRASAVGGEHSSKELFEQPIISYWEHLHEFATSFFKNNTSLRDAYCTIEFVKVFESIKVSNDMFTLKKSTFHMFTFLKVFSLL
jgi:hypothetical protein